MKCNQHKVKKERGVEMPISGGGQLTVTLEELVDYAKELDNTEEAERIELMCYRLFGHQLTPEAANKIEEIPQRFKKKNRPSYQKFVTINKGDNVEKKTVIPRVANYNENVEIQDNIYSVPQIEGRKQKKIANE